MPCPVLMGAAATSPGGLMLLLTRDRVPMRIAAGLALVGWLSLWGLYFSVMREESILRSLELLTVLLWVLGYWRVKYLIRTKGLMPWGGKLISRCCQSSMPVVASPLVLLLTGGLVGAWVLEATGLAAVTGAGYVALLALLHVVLGVRIVQRWRVLKRVSASSAGLTGASAAPVDPLAVLERVGAPCESKAGKCPLGF